MYDLYITKTFERRMKVFVRKHPELENKIQEEFDLLSNNPFNEQLKIHKLSGVLKNEWSIWLSYEYRITFVIENNNIYLTNIGSHDEVY
ncbi:MAG: type II toxin-antitoxin system YafQ family toxin [Candidatus Firestonebacteria bacterium]